ncbi:MAG: alpha/beta hydrolase [Alphaproteobacteria bacterium]|nr:alpha/beta hydrolase [Alphaproteobacteria bacterium]
MKPRSRCLWAMLLWFGLASVAQAQTYPDTAGISTIRIWPGTAPGSENAPQQENYFLYYKNTYRAFWHIAVPTLTAFYAAKPNGTSILILPGGGYRAVYFDDPPVTAARWLNTLGVDAYVLKYRLPDEGHTQGYNVPLEDAERSMRLIRSGVLSEHAGHKVDASRIGVMGFSAGGHLDLVLAIYHDKKVYEPIDPADALSARPDFMILAYAALELPPPNAGGRMPEKMELYQRYMTEGHIDGSLPPAFIIHGDMDDEVPYRFSVRLADELESAGVPVELHIFHGVGHAFSLVSKSEAGAWPGLCATWLRARGYLAISPGSPGGGTGSD